MIEQLPQLKLFMEVEEMTPPHSFSLKRDREEDNKDEMKKITKKRTGLVEVGWNKTWTKL